MAASISAQYETAFNLGNHWSFKTSNECSYWKHLIAINHNDEMSCVMKGFVNSIPITLAELSPLTMLLFKM